MSTAGAGAGGDYLEYETDADFDFDPARDLGALDAAEAPVWVPGLDDADGEGGGEGGGGADPVWDDPSDVPEEDEWYWAAQAEACSVDPGYLIDTFGIIDRPKAVAGFDEEPGEDEDEDERAGAALRAELDAGFDDAIDPAEAEAESGGEDAGLGLGLVRFRLWPKQVAVMGTLARKRLVVILKARQLGVSWLVCGYVLWLCLFAPGQAVLILSKGQKEANELIRRIKALYERLPAGLRRRLTGIVPPDNVRSIHWTNGSRIEAHPATKSAGVSYTASLVVMDEASRMAYGAELFDAIKPTIDAGNQLIMLSTAYGIGGLFHTTWVKAVAGVNRFTAVFLPWWSRPGRDAAWYRRIVAESNDPATVPENYPANPNEAFRASGRMRFALEWIVNQAGNVRAPIDERAWPPTLKGIPGLRLYTLPVPGRSYIIPADVAEGLEKGDFDDAVILDEKTWKEVGCLHGRWEPDEYAAFAARVGKAYNYATIIPERNNHGHAFIATLRFLQYPEIGKGHDGKQGWLTNLQTKPLSIDILAGALREGLVAVRSQMALDQLQNYYRLKGIETGAAPGHFDDIVMAWAIGLAYIRMRMLATKDSAHASGGEDPRPKGFMTGPGPLRTPLSRPIAPGPLRPPPGPPRGR